MIRLVYHIWLKKAAMSVLPADMISGSHSGNSGIYSKHSVATIPMCRINYIRSEKGTLFVWERRKPRRRRWRRTRRGRTTKKEKKRKKNEEKQQQQQGKDEEKEGQRLQRNKLHLQKVINQKEKSSQSNAQTNNSNGNALPSHRRWQILQKPAKVTRRTCENKGRGMDVEPWDKISRDSLFPSGTKPNTNPARPSGFWYEMLRQRTRSLVNQHLWINEIFTSKHLCLSFSLRQLLIFFFFSFLREHGRK